MKKSIYIKDNVLSLPTYNKLFEIYNETNFNQYTEHNLRYGFEIKDDDIIHEIKSKVSNNIYKNIGLKGGLSKIYLSKDIEGFNIPYHYDDDKKIISCVIYLNGKGTGTTFFDNKELTIDPKPNRLLCFESSKNFHCVKTTNEVRFTLQFSFQKM
jgi:hypothetical protein